jgi:rod shape-determining protein MreC
MRQLILFFAKYRSTLLLLVFVLIALLRHSLKNPLAEHRLNNVGFGAVATVHNGLSGWKQYWRLEAINEELARENARLRSGGTKASANHFSNSTDYDFIPARVVDYSYTKRNNYIIVHAGRRDGIQPGMGVMTANGWIGSVVEVSDAYAHITPVLHSKGNIGARISGKGLGELHWDGTDPSWATLIDIQRENRPMPGDSVYSFTRTSVGPSTLTGIVISAVQNNEDLTWTAKVALSADYKNMNWLYISKLKDAGSLDSLQVPAL